MSLFDVRTQFGSHTAFISNQAPAAAASLVALTAGKRIVVDLLVLSCGTAVATAFLNSNSTAITPAFNLGINGNLVILDPDISTVIGEALTLTSVGGSSTVSCFVRYHEE